MSKQHAALLVLCGIFGPVHPLPLSTQLLAVRRFLLLLQRLLSSGHVLPRTPLLLLGLAHGMGPLLLRLFARPGAQATSAAAAAL